MKGWRGVCARSGRRGPAGRCGTAHGPRDAAVPRPRVAAGPVRGGAPVEEGAADLELVDLDGVDGLDSQSHFRVRPNSSYSRKRQVVKMIL